MHRYQICSINNDLEHNLNYNKDTQLFLDITDYNFNKKIKHISEQNCGNILSIFTKDGELVAKVGV